MFLKTVWWNQQKSYTPKNLYVMYVLLGLRHAFLNFIIAALIDSHFPSNVGQTSPFSSKTIYQRHFPPPETSTRHDLPSPACINECGCKFSNATQTYHHVWVLYQVLNTLVLPQKNFDSVVCKALKSSYLDTQHSNSNSRYHTAVWARP